MTRKPKRTSKIGLILSVALFAACASGLDRFPAEHLYVVDVTNQACVKYKIIDYEKLLTQRESTARLVPGGDCDRLVGFHRHKFKSVQNWVRDAIEEFKKTASTAIERL